MYFVVAKYDFLSYLTILLFVVAKYNTLSLYFINLWKLAKELLPTQKYTFLGLNCCILVWCHWGKFQFALEYVVTKPIPWHQTSWSKYHGFKQEKSSINFFYNVPEATLLVAMLRSHHICSFKVLYLSARMCFIFILNHKSTLTRRNTIKQGWLLDTETLRHFKPIYHLI